MEILPSPTCRRGFQPIGGHLEIVLPPEQCSKSVYRSIESWLAYRDSPIQLL